MVNFYVKRIESNLMSINEVPTRWKAAVKKAIGK